MKFIKHCAGCTLQAVGYSLAIPCIIVGSFAFIITTAGRALKEDDDVA